MEWYTRTPKERMAQAVQVQLLSRAPKLGHLATSNEWYNAILAFDTVIRQLNRSDDPKDLLLKYAEKLIDATSLTSEEILRNTISAGMLNQNSCHTEFREIVEKMKLSSPQLWRTYVNMTSADRLKNKIADIEL